MQRTTYILLTIVIIFMMTTSSAYADIIRGNDLLITDIYTDLDEWLADVPPVTVIDFTDYPPDTIITDQYADLGIIFPNGFDWIANASAFTDGFGLANTGGRIRMEFDEPLTIFGTLFPGLRFFEFYYEGEMVGITDWQGQAVPGWFAGVILDTPFDEVHVRGSGGASIDNLYFTFAPIPAPGALALLGIAGFALRRSRRRRRSLPG